VRYVIRPGMNHHFFTFKDTHAAFAEKGGTFEIVPPRGLMRAARPI